MFGATTEPILLPWSWAVDRLTRCLHYWIATTRADGRPHSRPVWGVVLDGTVYFSTGSLAAGNLGRSPEISVHTESATEVVILEGVAVVTADRATIERLCKDYSTKYIEDMDPDHLPGPFYGVQPRVAFGWMASASFLDGGALFHSTATRWGFTPASA
jgi:hypothetical protein